MGLFTLLAALVGTISDTIKENKNENIRRKRNEYFSTYIV